MACSLSVNKVLHFSTNHFSVFGVGYKENTNQYTDSTNHWAKENIEFVTSRELYKGTSSTTFSPNMIMTRGMFVTVLGRLANANGWYHFRGKMEMYLTRKVIILVQKFRPCYIATFR